MVSEPVRTALYPVLVAIIGLLVAYGVLDEQGASLWLALAVAILGVSGVEVARSRVTPVTKSPQPERWEQV